MAGPRHHLGCKGNNCCESLEITEEEKVYLKQEPSNKHDKYAIKIVNKDDKILGYIPRYYSKQVSQLINNGAKCEIKLCDVSKNKKCNECLSACLKIIKE